MELRLNKKLTSDWLNLKFIPWWPPNLIVGGQGKELFKGDEEGSQHLGSKKIK